MAEPLFKLKNSYYKDKKINNLMDMFEHRNGDKVLLIGSGIFYWLGISSFAYLFKRIVLDTMFHIELMPYILKIVSELIGFATCVIGFYFVIRILKSEKVSDMLMFIMSLVLVLSSNVLGFFQPMIFYSLHTESSLENSSKYYSFFRENITIESIFTTFDFILFVVLGLMVYLNRNKTFANKPS